MSAALVGLVPTLAKLLVALLPVLAAFLAAKNGSSAGEAQRAAEIKDAQIKAEMARPRTAADVAQRLRSGSF